MIKEKGLVATVSILLDTPVSVVWKAVTDPVEVKKYFFGTDLVTEWTVGQPIYFRGEWEGKGYSINLFNRPGCPGCPPE